MKLLIKGGTILDPAAGKAVTKDILLHNGKISKIGSNLSSNGADVLEIPDKLVAPGLIDMHVHLREPGFEAKETIFSGTRAAARGGFTTVACMPNTNPVVDNAALISYLKNTAHSQGAVQVYPIGAISKAGKGEELAEMGDMREAGAVAFSDDGLPVMNASFMRRGMQYARMLGLTIISHCEDKHLSADGAMHEGYMSTMLGLKGIPAAAEEVMVARDIILAEETGCSLHIAHASTASSVQLIRAAKARGVKVTAEATPHHFTLTAEAVSGYDTNTKVNPPLRTDRDVNAVKEGLADGTIDVIASDHAPHAPEEKDVEYDLAPFGIVGLETTVGLVWTGLVATGILTPLQAIEKMTVNPATVLGLPKGRIETGADADLTVIDPALCWTVNPESFYSKGRNSPFSGMRLKGGPCLTIVAGQVVMRDGIVK